MGSNVSKQSIDTLSSVVTESLTQVTTELKNQNITDQSSYQHMMIDLGKVRGCKNINASQKAQISASVLVENSNDIANKMTTELMNTVEKELSNKLKQVNEDLNLGQANTAIMRTNSKTYLHNNLENNIKSGIQNTVKTSQHGGQDMVFYARDIECEKGGSLTFSQSMIMKTVAKNISENIVKNTIKAAITNDIKEKIKNDAEQLNKGIDAFAMVAIIAIIVCVIGGVFLYLRTGGIARTAKRNIDRIGKRAADNLGDDELSHGGRRRPMSRRQVVAYNKSLKLKAVGVAVICIGLFYQGYYVPEKQKIKDKYKGLI